MYGKEAVEVSLGRLVKEDICVARLGQEVMQTAIPGAGREEERREKARQDLKGPGSPATCLVSAEPLEVLLHPPPSFEAHHRLGRYRRAAHQFVPRCNPER